MSQREQFNWYEAKVMFGFPDAVIDRQAGVTTIRTLDLWRLLARLDYLEHRPSPWAPESEKVEPPKFMHYREGGWMFAD